MISLEQIPLTKAVEGSSVNYGLFFSTLHSWPWIEVEKQGTVTYSKDRENEVKMCKITSLGNCMSQKAHYKVKQSILQKTYH